MYSVPAVIKSLAWDNVCEINSLMVGVADPMRVFVSAVELGGFTAAADRLGITPSAVSKIIDRLESRLDVRLLNRTTRRIDMTREGETYFNSAKFILSEIDEMEAAVGQSSTHVKGILRVNVGTAFGNHQLMPKLPLFLERHPELTVSIDLTDRRIDIAAERADIVIRTGPVGDDALIARKVAEMRRVICAAPSYIAQHGNPTLPFELAQHSCLLFSDQPSTSRWPFRLGSELVSVEVSGRVTASSPEALLSLAIAGIGIARLGDVTAGAAIRSGELTPLLESQHLVEAMPISAVYLPGRHRSAKVTVFVDFLIEQFRAAPWRYSNPSHF